MLVWRQGEDREGYPVPIVELAERGPDDPAFLEVELTLEEAERFDAMGAPFGWRVAQSVREALGIGPGPEGDI
jgi:hypothetical protein